MFPDLSRQVYIINAPLAVMAAYKLIQAVLSEQSRQKVVFCGRDYQQTLIESIGADFLFERWGGKKKPSIGHVNTGTLRMGGRPPFHIEYAPEKNLLHVEEENLKKLTISAKAAQELELEAKEGDEIQWFFWTNGDVEFSILDGRGQEVNFLKLFLKTYCF